MKEAAANTYMNRFNIGSPRVKSVLVTRASARPMEFCYPPVHTNGPKLKSDCYEPMAVLLQLRELGGMQPPCCNCRRLLAYLLEVTGGRSLRRAAPRVNPNSQAPITKLTRQVESDYQEMRLSRAVLLSLGA